MEEEIKQAPTEVEEGTSPNDSESIDKKDSALIKSIKDKGAHSVFFKHFIHLFSITMHMHQRISTQMAQKFSRERVLYTEATLSYSDKERSPRWKLSRRNL